MVDSSSSTATSEQSSSDWFTPARQEREARSSGDDGERNCHDDGATTPERPDRDPFSSPSSVFSEPLQTDSEGPSIAAGSVVVPVAGAPPLEMDGLPEFASLGEALEADTAAEPPTIVEDKLTKRLQFDTQYKWVQKIEPRVVVNTKPTQGEELPHLKLSSPDSRARWKVLTFQGSKISTLIQEIVAGSRDIRDIFRDLGIDAGADYAYMNSIRYVCDEIRMVLYRKGVKAVKVRAGEDVAVAFYCLDGTGHAERKVIETLEAIARDSRLYSTNLHVACETLALSTGKVVPAAELRHSADGMTQEDLQNFLLEAQQKQRFGKENLTKLEEVALLPLGRSIMTEAIQKKEATKHVLFDIRGDQWRTRECPGVWRDATGYFKQLCLVRLSDSSPRTVVYSTPEEWLQGSNHNLCTLLLIGSAGIGKTTASKLLAQEIVAGKLYEGKTHVLNMKSIDSFGLLSHGGALEKAGCIVVHDVDFKASRGKGIGAQMLKSLFQASETGNLDNTRYKVGTIPKNVSRIIGLNPRTRPGDIFRKAKMKGFADYLNLIAPSEDDEDYKARLADDQHLQSLDEDTAGIARRVWVGFPTEQLVSDSMIQRFVAMNEDTCVSERSSRDKFWAENPHPYE